MYAYLGGGVTWDPPFSYGLVYRELPIQFAERLVAVILFFAEGIVDTDMIAVKPSNNPQSKLSPKEKGERVAQAAKNVSCHLSTLKERFPSRFSLLQHFGAEDLVCTLCQGTGKLTEGLSVDCPICRS